MGTRRRKRIDNINLIRRGIFVWCRIACEFCEDALSDGVF